MWRRLWTALEANGMGVFPILFILRRGSSLHYTNRNLKNNHFFFWSKEKKSEFETIVSEILAMNCRKETVYENEIPILCKSCPVHLSWANFIYPTEPRRLLEDFTCPRHSPHQKKKKKTPKNELIFIKSPMRQSL